MDSPLLRDGLILVDLPGSEDENAARSALAEKYIPTADEVIVAARYDKILTNARVQQLLNTGVKHQVTLNGRKRLTVVCTASDVRIPEVSCYILVISIEELVIFNS